MKLDLYNKDKEVVGSVDLPDEVFNVEANNDLMHEALVAQNANARQDLAHTKDRSEVRGGGRKPWRQKGTGRARHGSIRSPIWRSGGVTFGPRNEKVFAKKINKKVKRKALLMALSSKVRDKELIVLDKLTLDAPKTKEMSTIFNNLIADKKKSALLILPETNVTIARASHNIQGTEVIDAKSLNIVDVLKYKNMILTKDSISVIQNHYKM